MKDSKMWIYRNFIGGVVYLGDPADPKTVMLEILNKDHARKIAQADKMYTFWVEISEALEDKGDLSIWETCIKDIADDIRKEIEV